MLYKSLVLFYRQGEVLGCQLNSMASQGFFYFTVGKIYGNGLWSILVSVVLLFSALNVGLSGSNKVLLFLTEVSRGRLAYVFRE